MLFTPEVGKQYVYSTLEDARDDWECKLQGGWNISGSKTILVRYDHEERVCIDVWDDPDFRQKLKDLLDLNLNIIT